MFVIIVAFVLNCAEQRNEGQLFAAADVFVKGGVDGIFLGAVAAKLLGLFDQLVVDGEVGRHEVFCVAFYTSYCVMSRED